MAGKAEAEAEAEAEAVKKYVVRLAREEREQLEGIVRKGLDAAGKLTKARILLKADVSEVGGQATQKNAQS